MRLCSTHVFGSFFNRHVERLYCMPTSCVDCQSVPLLTGSAAAVSFLWLVASVPSCAVVSRLRTVPCPCDNPGGSLRPHAAFWASIGPDLVRPLFCSLRTRMTPHYYSEPTHIRPLTRCPSLVIPLPRCCATPTACFMHHVSLSTRLSPASLQYSIRWSSRITSSWQFTQPQQFGPNACNRTVLPHHTLHNDTPHRTAPRALLSRRTTSPFFSFNVMRSLSCLELSPVVTSRSTP